MIDWLVKPRQRVKYEGKYNFQLFLNTEHVDSSSTITITSFTDKTQRAAVPCNYMWFIIKNGLPQQVANFKGCTFICDTSHIGYYVQAHIISNDADFNGKAIVTFGPVELDVSLKTGILNALSMGVLQLPIYFVGPEQEQKQGTLQLYDSQIKLIHNFSEANYIFDYSIIEPQISPNAREITKATITFNERYELEMRRFQRRLFSQNELTSSKSSSCMNLTKSNLKPTFILPKLQIKFLSRQSRDSFFFAVKTFIAKRQLKNSAIIRKIENINFQKQQDFNAILQLDNLKSDLIRYDRLYKQAQMQKKKLQEDNSKMQKQLERNSKFGDLSMNVNYSAFTRRDDPIMLTRINKLEENNMQLNLKIIKLNNELEQAKGHSSIMLKPQMTLSPFSKKKQDDNQSLVGLLEDLSRCDPDRQIENLEKDKKQLQLKLQQSFEKINILENKLSKATSIISPSQNGINFTYKATQCSTADYLKIIERLKVENEQLQKINASLQTENRLLSSKVQKERLSLKNQTKIQSHLSKIRQQNRTTDMLIESKVQQQKSAKLAQQIELLTSSLKTKQDQLQKTLQKCINLQRKVHDSEIQMEMFRKNQDVLNRSQHMSIQMQNYNEEQIKMLKQHNDFLIEQNEKLVRACEKYMADAKQNNMLRKEIIQLKQKINHLRTNPQASFT